jgi:putative transposase
VAVLKEIDGGTPATAIARRLGVRANTVRGWRDKYAGLETSDLVRLKQLETENAQMTRIMAGKELELDAARELIEKTAGVLAAQRRGEGAQRAGRSVNASFAGFIVPLGCV